MTPKKKIASLGPISDAIKNFKRPRVLKNHGRCSVCKGIIPLGGCWTFTEQLRRVHSSPDDCVAVLHPKEYKKYLKSNPNFESRHRYQVPK